MSRSYGSSTNFHIVDETVAVVRPLPADEYAARYRNPISGPLSFRAGTVRRVLRRRSRRTIRLFVPLAFLTGCMITLGALQAVTATALHR